MFAMMTNWLFSPSGLTAHGFCLLWEPWLIWTHAGADALVGLAYFTIPAALARYGLRRGDIAFGPTLWLFAGFILLCGTGHWLDLLTIWVPAYRLEGVVKAATAIVSVITAVVVWRMVPVALSVPTAAQLQAAHDALRESELQRLTLSQFKDQFRQVVEASPTALMLVEDDGTIRMVNAQAEKMFGYDRAELHGLNLETLLPPNLRHRHAALRAGFQAARSPRAMGAGRALLGLRKDSTSFPIEIGLSPVEIGGVAGVLAGITDITARREAESAILARQIELEQSNAELLRARLRAEGMTRAKSRFLADMSHELRTPLNGILGYTELLRIEGGLNEHQMTRLGAMQVAGTHLLEMINSVLDLSKIEAGEVTVSAAETEICQLVRDCLDVVRPAATKKQLTLGLDIADDVPERIVVDASRLGQVLVNLLGNAVKFTDRGSVGVRIRRKCSSGDQAELRIDIADTGCGISADRRPSLFQEFERLGAAASVEGAGLGLAISAHLVTMMGGRLAHEDNEGGGSVFVLTLPLLGALPQPLAGPVCGPLPDREALAAHAAHEPAMTPSAPAAVPAASFRILIIDDVEMNRDIASAFLRAAGHTVTCAESGAQAVKIVAEGAWDVVLMDLRMPEMDGFEATRLIRALGGAKGRVPIVALTAHAFADQIEACSGAGMIGHVAKPFTQAALLSAVTNAVHASRTEVGTSPSGSDQTMRLPVLDLDAFETSASFLTPTKVTTCLAAIIDGAQSLQKSLRDCDVSGQVGAEILDAAHGVAGVAGMFGFVRLSAIARQFERAAQAEATLPPVITQCLHEALEASLLQARRRQRVAEASASESRPRSFHEDGDIQRAAQQKNVSAHPVGTA